MNFRLLLAIALLSTACAHVEDSSVTVAAAPLEGTHWELVQLGVSSSLAYEQQRQPSLMLDPQKQRAAGSGGCNRFMGSYTLDGERISFGQLAMTRMACTQGMDTEAAFTSALSQAKSWQVKDKRLELYDADGELLAEFVAQPLT